jgi:hypothetical protein
LESFEIFEGYWQPPSEVHCPVTVPTPWAAVGEWLADKSMVDSTSQVLPLGTLLMQSQSLLWSFHLHFKIVRLERVSGPSEQGTASLLEDRYVNFRTNHLEHSRLSLHSLYFICFSRSTTPWVVLLLGFVQNFSLRWISGALSAWTGY